MWHNVVLNFFSPKVSMTFQDC